MGKKILIIPDIHNKVSRANELILDAARRYEVTKIVFLGDYFDDWDDEPREAIRTARWLVDSFTRTPVTRMSPPRLHLIGNHDIHYLYPELPKMRCSGWSAKKQEVLLNLPEFKLIRSELKFFTWIDRRRTGGNVPLLATHAGLSVQFKEWSYPDITIRLVDDVRKPYRLTGKTGNTVTNVGWARSGKDSTGGILWCDAVTEFSPIAGVKQVFGHTQMKKPILWADGSMCIDTRLRGYGLYDWETQELTYEKVD